ncbi:hypothetical protein B0T20DRAFT_390724 [Sordaria brevicollis]|uniref:Uncharacterized protein n=1 Tax=Sordaria brevicollis TaxID=83679 RepID=A0AAE0UE43_SORBR|nr:hypothetical protein B0T20DRAFT_390724 [Sordaria brevicollis]
MCCLWPPSLTELMEIPEIAVGTVQKSSRNMYTSIDRSLRASAIDARLSRINNIITSFFGEPLIATLFVIPSIHASFSHLENNLKDNTYLQKLYNYCYQSTTRLNNLTSDTIWTIQHAMDKSTTQHAMDNSPPTVDPYQHLGAWAQMLDNKNHFLWTVFPAPAPAPAAPSPVYTPEEESYLKFVAHYPIPEIELEEVRTNFPHVLAPPPPPKPERPLSDAAKKNLRKKRQRERRRWRPVVTNERSLYVPTGGPIMPVVFSSEEAARGWHPELAPHLLVNYPLFGEDAYGTSRELAAAQSDEQKVEEEKEEKEEEKVEEEEK